MPTFMTMPDSVLANPTLLKVARLPKFKLAAAKTGSKIVFEWQVMALRYQVMSSVLYLSRAWSKMWGVAVRIAPPSFTVQMSTIPLYVWPFWISVRHVVVLCLQYQIHWYSGLYVYKYINYMWFTLVAVFSCIFPATQVNKSFFYGYVACE